MTKQQWEKLRAIGKVKFNLLVGVGTLIAKFLYGYITHKYSTIPALILVSLAWGIIGSILCLLLVWNRFEKQFSNK